MDLILEVSAVLFAGLYFENNLLACSKPSFNHVNNNFKNFVNLAKLGNLKRRKRKYVSLGVSDCRKLSMKQKFQSTLLVFMEKDFDFHR